MVKIVGTSKDDSGNVRNVRLKVGQSKSNEVCTILERPVTKIVLLLEREEVRLPAKEHQKNERTSQDN